MFIVHVRKSISNLHVYASRIYMYIPYIYIYIYGTVSTKMALRL